MVRIAIATPLEAELVERIREASDRVEVRFEPDLLPPTRYPGDHQGVEGFRREPEAQARWEEMLGQAEVLFGIPGDSPAELAAAIAANPGLRWVQGMAAGTGQDVKAATLGEEDLRRVAFTSASGVHAGPLAEFSLLGLLALTKDLPRFQADQAARRWTDHPVDELRGHTVLIVGLGAIGTEVARLAGAFGMRTIGVNRRGRSDSPHVDEVHALDRLTELLPRADALVLSLPLTDQTAGLLDAAALARLPRGAIVVNVGRGGVIDEPALIRALADGHLRGAALDVFATEPLPTDSPLWTMDNVIVTSHTAALSIRENERIVELFCDNLARYLDGRPLRTRIDTTHFY